MKVAISTCLAGTEPAKYNGGDNYSPNLLQLLAGCELIRICPEVAGGLPVPRPPVELVQGRAVNREGTDVDAEFRRGAQACLDRIAAAGVSFAVLQPRSPSCGIGRIYDGTFSGRLIPGDGIFAALLKEKGIPAVAADDLDGIRRLLGRSVQV